MLLHVAGQGAKDVPWRTNQIGTNERKARGSADWDASKLRASCGPPLRARCPLGKGHAKAHVPRRDRVPERHQWSTIHPYYMQPLPRSRPLIGSASSVWSGRHCNRAGVFMFGHCAALLWLASTPSRAFKSATACIPTAMPQDPQYKIRKSPSMGLCRAPVRQQKRIKIAGTPCRFSRCVA